MHSSSRQWDATKKHTEHDHNGRGMSCRKDQKTSIERAFSVDKVSIKVSKRYCIGKKSPEKPVKKNRSGMLIVYELVVKGDTCTCPKVQLTRSAWEMILPLQGLCSHTNSPGHFLTVRRNKPIFNEEREHVPTFLSFKDNVR